MCICCISKRGEKHKLDCGCASCKSQRGESRAPHTEETKVNMRHPHKSYKSRGPMPEEEKAKRRETWNLKRQKVENGKI